MNCTLTLPGPFMTCRNKGNQ